MPSITQKQRQLSLATPLGADMLGLRVVSVRDQMKPSRSASIGLPEAGVRSSLERLWLLATGRALPNPRVVIRLALMPFETM